LGKYPADFFHSTFAYQSSATLGDDDVTQAVVQCSINRVAVSEV
jgi:hypothetical protein